MLKETSNGYIVRLKEQSTHLKSLSAQFSDIADLFNAVCVYNPHHTLGQFTIPQLCIVIFVRQPWTKTFLSSGLHNAAMRFGFTPLLLFCLPVARAVDTHTTDTAIKTNDESRASGRSLRASTILKEGILSGFRAHRLRHQNRLHLPRPPHRRRRTFRP